MTVCKECLNNTYGGRPPEKYSRKKTEVKVEELITRDVHSVVTRKAEARRRYEEDVAQMRAKALDPESQKVSTREQVDRRIAEILRGFEKRRLNYEEEIASIVKIETKIIYKNEELHKE
jgi:hypothetical protein